MLRGTIRPRLMKPSRGHMDPPFMGPDDESSPSCGRNAHCESLRKGCAISSATSPPGSIACTGGWGICFSTASTRRGFERHWFGPSPETNFSFPTVDQGSGTVLEARNSFPAPLRGAGGFSLRALSGGSAASRPSPPSIRQRAFGASSARSSIRVLRLAFSHVARRVKETSSHFNAVRNSSGRMPARLMSARRVPRATWSWSGIEREAGWPGLMRMMWLPFWRATCQPSLEGSDDLPRPQEGDRGRHLTPRLPLRGFPRSEASLVRREPRGRPGWPP